MRAPAWILVAGVLTLGACAPAPPAIDLSKEEQAIRALDASWNTAIAKKDLDALVAFYAPDGATMWPDAPPSRGPVAIRAAWTELLKIPGVAATIVPDAIQVAQAGDFAFDEGHVDISFETPAGRAKETDKYVVCWKKVADGTWKVAYDVYNSNAPAAPPPPAPAAKGK